MIKAIRITPITIEAGNPNNYPETTHRKIDSSEIPECSPLYMKWTATNELAEMTDVEKAAKNAALLSAAKTAKITELSGAATQDIVSEYPEYKQINAALGIYDSETVAAIKGKISTARAHYYALVDMVEAASSVEEVQEINY